MKTEPMKRIDMRMDVYRESGGRCVTHEPKMQVAMIKIADGCGRESPPVSGDHLLALLGKGSKQTDSLGQTT